MREKLQSFPSHRVRGCLRSLSIVMSTSPNMLSLLETKGMQLNVLLNELNETFPPVNPTPSDELPLIYYRSGQRSVIEWIINKLDEN